MWELSLFIGATLLLSQHAAPAADDRRDPTPMTLTNRRLGGNQRHLRVIGNKKSPGSTPGLKAQLSLVDHALGRPLR